ncbi:MAG TPA: hypothetical protein VMU30_07760 [Bacteroidota bacterium]|nr:hypothetical protein [Bacteroidota bacterium]
MAEKPGKQRAAVFGGLLIGIISGLPGLNLLNCCCCAGILGGGLIAVYFYQKEFTDEMPPLESSDALILGIVAGIIGAVTSIALSVAITFLFGPVEVTMLRKFFDRLVQKMAEQGSVPQDSIDQMQEQFDQAIHESHTVGGILRSLITALILYPIFSMLGGLIGFSLFKKKKPPVEQQ